MRVTTAGIIAIALAGLAACSSTSDPGAPGGGGGGGGGPVGSVDVGPGIEFVSRHNGLRPAADTIAAGASVTWTWTGNLPHSVRSIGSPSFQSSSTMTGSGTYAVQFAAPGTYRYDCAVHGAAMAGTIEVR